MELTAKSALIFLCIINSLHRWKKEYWAQQSNSLKRIETSKNQTILSIVGLYHYYRANHCISFVPLLPESPPLKPLAVKFTSMEIISL